MPESNHAVCESGHGSYQGEECPTCNILRSPGSAFLSKLSSPARNALISKEITTLEVLSTYTEKQLLKLHGVGPASLPTLRASLKEKDLSFKS